MDELQGLMERELRAVPVRPFELDALERRRDRKRRRERVAAIVVAIALSAVALGWALGVLRSNGGSVPASPPPITPRSVGDLQLEWHTRIPGGAWTPAIADGVIYTGPLQGTGGGLAAYPLDCVRAAGCPPMWTTTTGPVDTPVVADGIVYVETSSFPNSRLLAYRVGCGSGGATCEPLWTAALEGSGGADNLKPVVSDGNVYVATSSRVYAFPLWCTPVDGSCAPSWWAPVRESAQMVTVGDGFVFVGTVPRNGPGRRGTVYAFAATGCTGRCRPVWARPNTSAWSVSESDGVLYVGRSSEVMALPAVCDRPDGCDPLWTSPRSMDPSSARFVGPVVDGRVYVLNQAVGLEAFDTSCTGTCEPVLTGVVPQEMSSSPPTVADGVAYVMSQMGEAYAFDAACSGDCDALWQTQFPRRNEWGGIAVAEGHVVLGSQVSGLRVYSVPPGSPTPAPAAATDGGAFGGPLSWLWVLAMTVAVVVVLLRARRRPLPH